MLIRILLRITTSKTLRNIHHFFSVVTQCFGPPNAEDLLALFSLVHISSSSIAFEIAEASQRLEIIILALPLKVLICVPC